MARFSLATLLVLGALATASAHPQHSVKTPAQQEETRRFLAQGHRSLAACKDSPAARALSERTAARRMAQLDALRHQRRLSIDDVLAKSHKSNLTGVTPTIDPSELFGTEVKCVLEPEVTEGPYYVNGEFIRSDIREGQAGVDLYTDLQFIDINTCEPVPNLFIDFWHCNSTGVYSGVVAGGNGNSGDATNINNTAFRGLYPTDDDGVVQFLTLFPGHYTGRATHIHILGSYNGTVLSNNTYAGSVGAHVGQIFFDQSLISEVEATAAYAVNTQQLTLNAADSILKESAATGFDPVVEYALLGDTVEDGLFSWISVGVDTTIAKTVSAAATLTENGGVANSNGGGGGGGPPPFSGSGSRPAPPS